MAALTSTGTGLDLLAQGATTFDVAPVTDFFESAFLQLAADFEAGNFTPITRTAAAITADIAGGRMSARGTGVNTAAGSFSHLDFTAGADKISFDGTLRWNAGGITQASFRTLDITSSGVRVKLTGTPSWDEVNGLGGTATLVDIFASGMQLQLRGTHNLSTDSGNFTSLTLISGTSKLVIDGNFDSAACLAAISGAAGSLQDALSAAGVFDGIDTLKAATSLALAPEFEHAVLTGNTAVNATGHTGVNSLTGNNGNNTLDGGAGADVMAGGSGNDTFIVDDTGDAVSDTTGIDTVISSVSFTLATELERLTLAGTGDTNGSGNTSANILTGNDGDNTLNGGAGADTMAGGAGDDTFIVDNVRDVVMDTAGTDTVHSSVTFTLGADIETLVLTGTGMVNAIGNTGNNTLLGSSGANTLDGKAGADTMSGGTGKDTYIVDNTGDVVIETSANAAEIDTVRASADVTLSTNVENVVLTAATRGTGNTLANSLTGSAGSDTLDGAGGNDKLAAGAGDDVLIADIRSGIALDTLDGGTGTDTLVLRLTDAQMQDGAILNAIAALQAAINAGNRTPFTSTALGLKITGIERLQVDADGPANTAPANISLSNASLPENAAGAIVGTISVTDADSGDTHSLGVDDNRFEIVNGQLRLKTGVTLDFESEPSITVTITATDNGGLSLQKQFTLSVTNTAESLFTNGADNVDFNTLAAGAFSGFYDAQGGNDTILLPGATQAAALGYASTTLFNAGGGNDTITSRGQVDTIAGGAGDDVFYIGTGDIVVEATNGGIDTVYTDISYILPDNVENLTQTGSAIINATGNALDNIIISNGADGHYTIDGGAGADTMVDGATGNIYVVDNTGDVIVEHATDPSADTVYSSISYTLTDNVEVLRLTGTSAINGSGNALQNELVGNSSANRLYGDGADDRLYGEGGHDTLDGGTGDDILEGGDGNDYLDGGAGGDVFLGGVGDDTFVVDSADDYIEEYAGEGTDTVLASASYSLSFWPTENIEGLTLTGTSAIDGTGNAEANIITGNTAANRLDGMQGADTLTGGTGADVFVINHADARDVITDFKLAEGDSIDLRDLLEGYDPGSDSITDFLAISASGFDAVISVDIDGAGSAHGMAQVALVKDAAGLDLLALGALVTT